MKLKIAILFLIFFNVIISSSIFDKAKWEYQSKRNNIKLFKTKDRFYKVETVLNYNNIEDLVLYLTTRDYYLKIFPNTVEFKTIKKIRENKYLIYEIISFAPLKSRDCFFELEVNSNNDECTIEWAPVNEFLNQNVIYDPDNIHVEEVFGRWIIRKINKNKIYISMEFYNNFKFNLPDNILLNFEKEESFKILKNLKIFLVKEKKLNFNE